MPNLDNNEKVLPGDEVVQGGEPRAETPRDPNDLANAIAGSQARLARIRQSLMDKKAA